MKHMLIEAGMEALLEALETMLLKKQMHLELLLQLSWLPPGSSNTESSVVGGRVGSWSFLRLAWNDRQCHFFKAWLQKYWVQSSAVERSRRLCVGLGQWDGPAGNSTWRTTWQSEFTTGTHTESLRWGICNPGTQWLGENLRLKKCPEVC